MGAEETFPAMGHVEVTAEIFVSAGLQRGGRPSGEGPGGTVQGVATVHRCIRQGDGHA